MIKKRILKWIWNRKLGKIKEGIRFEKGKNVLFMLEETEAVEMISLTGIFHGLKHEYPDLKMGVVASKENAEFIRNNPYIDKIYIYRENWQEIGKNHALIEGDAYDIKVGPAKALELRKKYGRAELYPMDHYIYRAQGYRGWLKGQRMVLEMEGCEVKTPKSEGIQDVIALISLADEVKSQNPLIEAIVSVFEEEKSDKAVE